MVVLRTIVLVLIPLITLDVFCNVVPTKNEKNLVNKSKLDQRQI